jgi:hypothetical protein
MCSIVFSASVFAQTTAFTYQGSLKDGVSAANGTYEMQFSLFDAAADGNPIGSVITNTNVSVSKGIFSVELDFASSSYPGADRWLEIKVKKPGETDYTTLAPRQKINSVPYAVRAANVSTTSGNNVVEAINNVATTTTINENRLPSNIVRLLPSTEQIFSGDTPGIRLTKTGTWNGDGNFLSFRVKDASITSAIISEADQFIMNMDGSFLARGDLGVGKIPTTGAGIRMMWHPYRAGFRAGQVDGEQWNDGNIGFFSWAGGINTTAAGFASFAFGDNSKAAATGSIALGKNNTTFAISNLSQPPAHAFAVGESNNVCGYTGMALGYGNNAGCDGNLIPPFNPSSTADKMSVAIGYRNVATGNYSIAMGKYASTNDFSGTFVWSDASNTNTNTAATNLFTATANNQFSAKASGGVRFYTKSDLSTGVTLSANGGSWTSVSDRNAKDNIVAVNPRDILKGVLKLPISTWNYKGQSFRHIGAMAQDFYSTFNVGENDKTITTVDPDGVALAAIQGLNEELKDELKNRDVKIERQQQQIAQQQQQITQLQERDQKQQIMIDEMKKLLCISNPSAGICK